MNAFEFLANKHGTYVNMGVSIHSEDNKKDFWYSRYSGLSDYRKHVAKLWGYVAYCNQPDPAKLMEQAFASGAVSFGDVMNRINGHLQSPAMATEQANAKINHAGQWHFLYASDCEGSWTPAECALMILELKKIDTAELTKLGGDCWEPDLGEMHKKFIKGLEYCVKKGQKAIIG
jgi:hypothetical protein